MKLAQVNEAMDHKITSGSEYGWRCFPDARFLDYESEFANVSVVYNTRTQEIYQADVSVKRESWSTDSSPYRWTNPEFKSAHIKEAEERTVDPYQAWDDVKWTELEVEEDWLEKATAMFNGDEWDERIQVPVDFSDSELLRYMKMAHEQDITFNQFIERILRNFLEQNKNDLNS